MSLKTVGSFVTRRIHLLFLLSLVAIALPLHADTGGCTDSPENPTVLLAVVGGVGVLIARYRASRGR